VVIPCFNEEHSIARTLEGLVGQYDGDCEIIVVDGMSTDGTRRVVEEFAPRNPDVRVRLLDNPRRSIPSALNLGIGEAGGDLIVRMDAHSSPSPNYVRRCAELLSNGRAAVVGMPWRIRPGASSLVARAIACAVAHPFGVGDARYRLETSTPRLVDTVPFGAFEKSLWRDVGGFDERLLTNEDYDFNYRVRARGGRILLDTEAHCEYYARASPRSLMAQYARYGSWKARMVKLHPRSIRLRQVVAPAFIAFVVLSSLLGLWLIHAWWMLLAVLATYALLAGFFAFRIARVADDWRIALVVPLAFLVMHGAWGLSFLVGLVRRPPVPTVSLRSYAAAWTSPAIAEPLLSSVELRGLCGSVALVLMLSLGA
jgi:glycosyltransferase involved in cell wall biosynthesis